MRFMTKIVPALMLPAVVATALPFAATPVPAGAQAAPVPQIKRIYGILVGVDLTKNLLSLKKRNGQIVLLDMSQAIALQQVGVLPINRQVVLWGIRGPDKMFHVQSIGHSAPTQSEWGDDNDSGDANSQQ
ncbi:MAG: hypothetical protein JWN27_2522 [Candidatus Eremiobacteraeota bacterium]|nr:hypothetical protein [Candidatus Eremiobacteraeota bacterium]